MTPGLTKYTIARINLRFNLARQFRIENASRLLPVSAAKHIFAIKPLFLPLGAA